MASRSLKKSEYWGRVGFRFFTGASPAFIRSSNAIGYAEFYSRSHDALIRVYDDAGNVIETHEHAGRGQGAVNLLAPTGAVAELAAPWSAYAFL